MDGQLKAIAVLCVSNTLAQKYTYRKKNLFELPPSLTVKFVVYFQQFVIRDVETVDAQIRISAPVNRDTMGGYVKTVSIIYS